MADTTNDIWNDNDGEEDEAPRKGGRLRRFGIFFLVLAAVLGVVLVAAYRDGTGFDALRRLFSYGSGEESTAEAQYDYDASDSNRFAVLGGGGRGPLHLPVGPGFPALLPDSGLF